MGTAMNTAPAAKRANSVSGKDMSPTATVHKSLFFNKSFGKMKSLHGHANCVSNVYTKIGLDNGTVIVQKMRILLAPSMRAAS